MSVKDVQARVHRILTDQFGSVTIDRDGVVRLENESAVGFVSVVDWGDGDTIVKVWSPMLRDVDLTPELFRWVAVEGQGRWFAHARIWLDSDNPRKGGVGWEYDLLGNFLDPEELLHCVGAVMVGSNKLDDELQSKFGGKRASD